VNSIPIALTLLRLLLAPVLVWMVYVDASEMWFATAVSLAFASDYLDGVVARRLGVATPALRHFDSRADLVFYATAAWAVWMRRPDVARAVAVPALVVIGLDVLRYIFDFAKFGRDVAYHAWSSKVWGLSLALALVLLLGFGIVQPFVWIAVWLGVIAQIEGLLISAVLPQWTTDVPTIFRAMDLKKGRTSPPRRGKRRV
jgi:CDP-diacylglycerol--glycerol-3-phosphate 3-phosphatidyltransferase